MPETGFQVTKSGSIGRTKIETPDNILATGHVKESYLRVWIAGGLLGFLAVAYIVAICQKYEGASSILVVISGGIGYLLGRESKGARGRE